MPESQENIESNNWPFDIKRSRHYFDDSEVYYSGSIRGVLADPTIGKQLVTYMIRNGAYVSSAHVAATDKAEMKRVFFQMSQRETEDTSISAELAYEVDMGWVDSATHLISVVDGPSHGVGIEIARALHKPFRGLNTTPTLCLVHENNYENLSFMVKGLPSDPLFKGNVEVVQYKSIRHAKQIIKNFINHQPIES